jgi:peptidyl-prolyl cis-trans isomerase B (cyclophilin B)
VASNKRERELARLRAERQAARRADAQARRRQRRNTILASVAGLAVVGLIAGVALWLANDEPSKNTLAAPAASASASASAAAGKPGTCSYPKSGAAAKKVTGAPATTGVQTTGTRHAVLKTSRGTVAVELLASKAPCTVNSFAFLAGQKYYDKTPCPRLVSSGIFVLQCGDPTGTGSGGPGYSYADENLTGATYPKGTLAMANSGPNTNGSQFFVVYKDTQLPPSYTPFGTITKGLDIIEKVAAGGDDGSHSAGGGKPKLPIDLVQVTVA